MVRQVCQPCTMVGTWTVNGVGLSASDVGSRSETAFAGLSVPRSTCGSDRGPLESIELSLNFLVSARNGIEASLSRSSGERATSNVFVQTAVDNIDHGSHRRERMPPRRGLYLMLLTWCSRYNL